MSLIFGLLFAAADAAQHWADGLKYLLAMAVILFPLCALMLGAIYFFRHRRELQKSRDDLYQSALLQLPRQIEELGRQVAELRRQVSGR